MGIGFTLCGRRRTCFGAGVIFETDNRFRRALVGTVVSFGTGDYFFTIGAIVASWTLDTLVILDVVAKATSETLGGITLDTV